MVGADDGIAAHLSTSTGPGSMFGRRRGSLCYRIDPPQHAGEQQRRLSQRRESRDEGIMASVERVTSELGEAIEPSGNKDPTVGAVGDSETIV
jgi:hypothetical protein